MSSLIQDNVCVEANVKVAPDVKINNIQTHFVGEPVVEDCAQNTPESSYEVSQMLCVKYSLAFSADVEAEPSGIICSPPTEDSGEQAYTKEQVSTESMAENSSNQLDFSDVFAGPSVSFGSLRTSEIPKDFAGVLTGPLVNTSELNTMETPQQQDFPEIPAEPSATKIELKNAVSKQQASRATQPKNKNTPAPRFANRNIIISKDTYKTAFYYNPTFRFGR